ncbi:MAG TPA: transglycosylase SLT domain-containing protein [Thermodesulfovibrionales bacterium]|nr:transglycosylase SLT domain-containing protein [Thermodesulfovibrionales bacterium]
MKSVVFLFLLFSSPPCLFASETERGTGPAGPEITAPFQSTHNSEALLPGEQNQSKASGDKATGEGPSHSPKAEAPPSESGRENVPVASYPSNAAATKAVDKSIWLFTERIKERFSLYLERSGKYIELMREILKTYNIPEDIAFLPIIESGFNPEAYSVARAVGPWQFIAGTAKKYGLKIDWWRDERKDPVKSTVAAANYLRDLYEMFGSWNLAMAAYNAGEGKIYRALSRSKSDNYWALLNTRHIKKETKEYVPRFIAAKLIASDPRSYGFDNLAYHAPLAYDEVILLKPIDLETAAQCAETSLEAIKDLNPEIRRWSTPANVSSYPLKIPFGKKTVFSENLLRIPEDERLSVVRYTVKKGDTVKKIAGKTGFPVSVIAELNNDSPEFRAGDTILLPPKDKCRPDRDDRLGSKKAAVKKAKVKKQSTKKIVVTSLDKKKIYAND